jgi:glycosyltransferase involved in cell wall biosynthesis
VSGNRNSAVAATLEAVPEAGGQTAISVILPCRNEAAALGELLPAIRRQLPEAELLVVDDGSTDHSRQLAESLGARVIAHPYPMGNGAAIKTGARNARGSVLVFMDADGQHDPADIPRLLACLNANHDMAIGARETDSQASHTRRFGNGLLNRLASLMTGYRIRDLTCGFRAVRARQFRRFLYLLPNGFSYPTTITMAFFRSGFPVAYVPIRARQRAGRGYIGLGRDGLRFFIIVLKIGALFSPMRLFLPIALGLFCAGCMYYGFTYYASGRFTNMGAMLFLSSLMTFLIGILSEQVSSLHYRDMDQAEFRVSGGPHGPE